MVCASSGCKWACKRHDIGTQCGATATNIAAETTIDYDITFTKSNQQNIPKLPRQLVVATNPADEFPDDLENYVEPDKYKSHPAALVLSGVPNKRTPPFMNTLTWGSAKI